MAKIAVWREIATREGGANGLRTGIAVFTLYAEAKQQRAAEMAARAIASLVITQAAAHVAERAGLAHLPRIARGALPGGVFRRHGAYRAARK